MHARHFLTAPLSRGAGAVALGTVAITLPGLFVGAPAYAATSPSSTSLNEVYNPQWESVTAEPGQHITLPYAGTTMNGTTTVHADFPAQWNVSYDKATSSFTAVVPANAIAQTAHLAVTITYADGSQDVATPTVKVLAPARASETTAAVVPGHGGGSGKGSGTTERDTLAPAPWLNTLSSEQQMTDQADVESTALVSDSNTIQNSQSKVSSILPFILITTGAAIFAFRPAWMRKNPKM